MAPIPRRRNPRCAYEAVFKIFDLHHIRGRASSRMIVGRAMSGD